MKLIDSVTRMLCRLISRGAFAPSISLQNMRYHDSSRLQAQQKADERHVQNVSFVQEDIEELKLDEDQFDCILCASAFPYFQDIHSVLVNCRSWLKSGCSLNFCTPKVPPHCPGRFQHIINDIIS